MRGHKELLWIIPYNFLHLLAPSHVHYVCDFCSSLAPAETCQLPQPHSLTVEILDLLIARCANFGTWLFFRVWRRRPRWTTLAVIRHVGHGREDHKNHLSPDSWDLFNSKKLGTIFSAKALPFLHLATVPRKGCDVLPWKPAGYEYPDGSVSSKTKLCCPEEAREMMMTGLGGSDDFSGSDKGWCNFLTI